MSKVNFNNQLYKSLHMNQNTPLALQEEEELLSIKMKLFKEINLARHRYALAEFYEDHCISRIINSRLNTTLIKAEDIVNLLNHKISPTDIEIISSMRTVSGITLSKTDPMATLENLYMDMLIQMMNISHKDKFMDKRYNNIAFSLTFFNNQANMTIVLSRTIVSIENIYLEGDIFHISGSINNSDYLLFILMMRTNNNEIFISPNRMSYDTFNQIFHIKIEKDIIERLATEEMELEFYVKKGRNTIIKYGQGDDLTREDVVKMSPILTLAYSMPLQYVESPHVHVKNFLSAAHNTSFNQTPYLGGSQNNRHLMNSPIPNFANLNKGLRERPSVVEPTQQNTVTPRRSFFFNKPSGFFGEFKFPWSKRDRTSNKAMQEEDEVMKSNTKRKSSFLGFRRLFDQVLGNNKQPNPANENTKEFLWGNNNANMQQNLNANYNNIHDDFTIYTDNNANSNQQSFGPHSIPPQPQQVIFPNTGLINSFANMPQGGNYFPNPDQVTYEMYMNQTNRNMNINPNVFRPVNDHANNPLYTQRMPENYNPVYPQNLNANRNNFTNENQFPMNMNPNPTVLYSKRAPPKKIAPLMKKKTQISSDVVLNPSMPQNTKSEVFKTINRTYNTIHNFVKVSGYNPTEETIDPNLFRSETLSEEARSNLDLLEERLLGVQPDRVQQFVTLYETQEMQDVILGVKGEEIRAHRVVLLQSQYFVDQLKNTKATFHNEPARLRMPDCFRPESLRRVLRYMYHAELEKGEIETMNLPFAREMLLTAYRLKLFHLMKVLIVRVIIPKMDKSMCLEFLRDTFEREDAKILWKTLQHYCLNYFAVHSKSILSKYSKQIMGFESKLTYKLISKALMKCRDIEHMYELLAILVETGFAANLYDILEKVPLANDLESKRFDVKYISFKDEIVHLLDSKKCFETDLITCNDAFVGTSYSSKILEEKSTPTVSPGKSPQKKEVPNHLELNLRYNSKKPYNSLGNNEWAEIKRRDANYEMKIELTPSLKNKTIISQSFDSETRSWHLVVDIEEDQRMSVYLLEKGSPSHTKISGPFKYEFTTVRFLIQIKDGESDFETVIFHSFANDHNYCVGHRRLFNLAHLTNKNFLHLKIWMLEFPIYSCSLQYLSTRFNDLLKEALSNKDISKIISLRNDERIYLGTRKNDLNQRQRKPNKTEEDYKRDELRKRKSMNALEINFFRQMDNVNSQKQQENTQQENVDPLAANALNPNLASGTGYSQAQFINNIPRANTSNQNYLEVVKQSRVKKFEELCPYDFYYIVSSDYLLIEHEKFLAAFLYSYALNKPEDMINLIVAGLRFSYLELSKLFNLARDLHPIKQSAFFISKLDFEVSKRINSNEPFDRPRRFYSPEMYKNWNFKTDLMNWLIESDHHEGYKIRLEELQKIIQQKEEQLRSQEMIISQMNAQINHINHLMNKRALEDGTKKIRVNPPEMDMMHMKRPASSPNWIGLIQENCNIF